jgi:ribosomal protein S18 acetylase RimI-like enzyme
MTFERMTEKDKNKIGVLSRLLVESFIDADPVVDYWLPKSVKKRAGKLCALFEVLLKYCVNCGSLYVNRDMTACLLWFGSYDKSVNSLWNFIAAGGLKMFFCGFAYCLNLLRYNNLLERVKSEKFPHILYSYLYIVAVSPSLQRKGMGAEILRDVLKDCDRQNRMCLLETREELIPFYGKLGFSCYHKETIPKTAIIEVFMKRDPLPG